MNDDLMPLLRAKEYREPSVFEPANLLREGRRQRGRPDEPVPAVCLLDPDGDIVRHLIASGTGTDHTGWACYHTTLWTLDLSDTQLGVVGCAVGAPFAVLVAEQLFASGCDLLISITSSGSITRVADPPYFVIIDRALRDEGTSLHYLPPSDWAHAPRHLVEAVTDQITDLGQPVVTGSTWTTDAPYRETLGAIEAAAKLGVIAVEMEAAALYAFATVHDRDVLCVAHVTNTMATDGDDFEKGEANGAVDALRLTGAMVGKLKGPKSSDSTVNPSKPTPTENGSD